jgi:hypothetical protein
MPCAVEGCDRPAHGGSALCRGHKERRQRGGSLSTRLRPYERDPEQAVLEALRRFDEATDLRRQQLDDQLRRRSDLQLLLAAVRAEAEASAEDEQAWQRARAMLRQALARYRERTAKHKGKARRRR